MQTSSTSRRLLAFLLLKIKPEIVFSTVEVAPVTAGASTAAVIVAVSVSELSDVSISPEVGAVATVAVLPIERAESCATVTGIVITGNAALAKTGSVYVHEIDCESGPHVQFVPDAAPVAVMPGVAACGGSSPPAQAPAVAAADTERAAGPAAPTCPRDAPALIVAMRAATSQADWTMWRGLLSRSQADQMPATATPGVSDVIMAGWNRDLAGFDATAAVVEDDGIRAAVVAPLNGSAETVMFVVKEGDCLLLDEN